MTSTPPSVTMPKLSREVLVPLLPRFALRLALTSKVTQFLPCVAPGIGATLLAWELIAMKTKTLYIIGGVVIIVAITFLGVVQLQRKETDPVITYKATIPESRATIGEKEGTVTQSPKDAKTSRLEEIAANTRSKILDIHDIDGQPKSSYVLALEKAMNSPAYLAYIEEQSQRSSFSFRLWYDFLESQGVRSGRYLYENRLRNKYNFNEPLSYYEPMMREQMAELFLTAEDPTDKIGVLMQFTATEENTLWYLAYFGGEGDKEWIDDTQRNAANIVASATSEIITAPTQQGLTTPSHSTNIAKEVDPQSSQREDVSIKSGLEERLQILEEIEAPFRGQQISEVPKLPTEAAFKNALRERFSPQRFNTAMQTLNQYGPKEGLRRIKESDPEVAAQVERLIQRQGEKD